MNLTAKQQDAVDFPTNKNCSVIAVAGSGKTTVLVRRLQRLREEGNNDILALTFSKKAGEEIANRVGTIHPRTFIGTFHSFAYRLLRKQSDIFKGLADPMLGGHEEFRLFVWAQQAITELGIKDIPAKDIIRGLEALLTLGHPPAAWGSVPEVDRDLQLLAKATHQRMRRDNKFLFTELLVELRTLLSYDLPLLTRLRERFPIVMVDEFQDTDPIQVELLKLILGDSGSLFAVGDCNQAIYGFRGCELRSLLKFEETFGNSETIVMNDNFRSYSGILDCANQLIENNVDRSEAPLLPCKNGVANVFTVPALDSTDEARQLADLIQTYQANGRQYDDIAILSRTNAQLGGIESELARRNIPFQKFDDRGGFFARTEIKALLAYMELASDPSSVGALETVWNRPNRFLKKDWLSQAAASKDTTDAKQITHFASMKKMGGSQRKNLGKLTALITFLTDVGSLMEPQQLLQEIMRRTEYNSYLKTLADKSLGKSYQELTDATQMLMGIVGQFNSHTSLRKHVQLVQETARKNREKEGGVQLLTVHRAKGLEFPVVLMTGFTDELMPHKDSDDIEEERRIVYVAITRAEEELGFAYTGKPSRFLKEFFEDVEDDSEIHTPVP